MKNIVTILLLFTFISCQRYIYVQQESIDGSYLASSRVGTPDPRAKNPKVGQQLNIYWDFPLSLYKKELTMYLTVRFWDSTEEVFQYPITKKRDIKTYFFKKQKGKKLLTYKIDIVSKENKIVDTWKHQLWKELITVE